MAKRATTAKTKTAGKKPGADAVFSAAMTLAAEQGWRRVGFGDIAAKAGLSESALAALFADKAAILDGILAKADAAVAEGGTRTEDDPPRDRLFEAVMRRFDALAPYRQGLGAVLKDLPADPLAALRGAMRLRGSMAKTLDGAGIDSGGICGRVRVKGLALIYLDVLRTFVADEGDDLGKTMAALDKRLKQADELVGFLARFR
ncbi:MAG: TetR/AcrR family transcriptional regulator, partial [Alphaproteobacteria bacterium]|nr:TetR/AcrR family transcriptional regulator [Alphaproteobacteria bacterium]